MKSSATRWAPAPSIDMQADSRITVGNSSASARPWRGSGKAWASARNTGSSKAARPDVDGTTSVALMFDFLSTFHSNLDYYLPATDEKRFTQTFTLAVGYTF